MQARLRALTLARQLECVLPPPSRSTLPLHTNSNFSRARPPSPVCWGLFDCHSFVNVIKIVLNDIHDSQHKNAVHGDRLFEAVADVLQVEHGNEKQNSKLA